MVPAHRPGALQPWVRLYLSVIAALILSRPAIADPLNSTTLLQKIAATYQGILDYSVEVETKVSSTVTDSPATKTRYVLASSKPKRFFSSRSASVPRFAMTFASARMVILCGPTFQQREVMYWNPRRRRPQIWSKSSGGNTSGYFGNSKS